MVLQAESKEHAKRKSDAQVASELEKMGILNAKKIYYNLPVPRLIELALERGEGIMSETGALSVKTGKYSGRSPNDKFIVDSPAVHGDIDWGSVNVATTPEVFERLHNKQLAYLHNREIFVFDGFVGADPKYRMPIRIINEYAWQNVFVQQLFIRPTEEELSAHKPEFTVVCTPNMRAIPEVDSTKSECAIMINFEKKVVMIVASGYAGEMKKSIFTIMNYLLPKKGVFPMHCSANVGKDGDTALFFGLSGTGKTTLSADPNRRIIGDDEHGWTPDGIFNFEGGCYAKCIKLRKENEPQIWEAIRFGAVLENTGVDPVTRKIDFDDASLTENTRAAYPVEYIPGAIIPGLGRHPKTVVFLTADAFGVLPPIAKLTKEQAMYHFLSGYTSKLAGTERGITEPQATFSTCFGAPFMPMPPIVYAKMLGECITKHNSNVFLINTGWSGGAYGVGKRISIKHTRAMVTAALDGKLDNVKYRKDEAFNLLVPEECPGVPPEVLNPRNTWKNGAEYDKSAKELAARFVKNFTKFKGIPKEVIEAGPKGQ